MSLLIKGVEKHTQLGDKDPGGTIDHADGSVVDAKLASGVGLNDGQIAKLPAASSGEALVRGALSWGAGKLKLGIKKDSSPVIGSRGIINFRQGVGINLQVEDDPADDEVEVTLGSSAPYKHIVLLPEDAILPTVNPPARITTNGTNFSYQTLDYDPITEEKAYWECWLPPDYNNENIIVDIFWKSAAAGSSAKFGVQVLGRKAGETWDSPMGTEKTAVDASAGAGIVNKATVQTFSPNWEGQDVILFKVARKATDPEDTIDGDDVSILKAVVKYTTTFNQAFYPLAAPVLLPNAGTWQNYCARDYGVPIGATGVWIHVYNDQESSQTCKFRMKGSSDDELTQVFGTFGYMGQHWVWVGLDEDGYFQAHFWGGGMYLCGYTGGAVVFFEDPIDVTPGVAGSWQNVNISSYAPNAIGAIVRLRTSGSNYNGVRRDGCTQDLSAYMNGNSLATWQVVGTESQVFEAYIGSISAKLWLLGYITDGAVFLTTAIDKTPGTVGSYVEVDYSSYPKIDVPFLVRTGGLAGHFAVRKKGWPYDIYRTGNQSACQACMPCDANSKQEIMVSHTNCYLYLVGYSTHAG